MTSKYKNYRRYVEEIKLRKLSIYDPIKIGDPKLWIPILALENVLKQKLKGISLAGLPLRTRSKVLKQHVCQALGYPIPSSFKKTKPRFPGQLFDTYIQKSNNLQIWNEEIVANRRYVIIRISDDDEIANVKVVTGETLASLDTTGTLTQKYQARFISSTIRTELITEQDTVFLRSFVNPYYKIEPGKSPVDQPMAGQLLSIKAIYKKLSTLIGISFPDRGYDQERNRGAELHRLVCKQLGYTDYRDIGQFPDLAHQLLEVKLQTSPTIDLGLISPNSTEALKMEQIGGRQIRHCDVRYALFYARTDGQSVTLTNLVITAGEGFFNRFPQFGGKIINKKLQIPLPANFFSN